MKKNVGSQSIGVQMVNASTGADFTGSVTVVITIDNGTQTASAGSAPVHEGNGYHSYSPTQAETNGDHLAFTFSGSGAVTHTVQTFTGFPQTANNETRLATIEADTNELQGDDVPGLISTLDAVVDTVKAETALIVTDTAEIGTAGAGLTDLGGMSTGMKAEVNTEADTALTDYDPPTRTEATSDKDAILTRGNVAWITGAGSGGDGAFPITVTLTDGTDPLENVNIRVYLGASSFVLSTDASGNATFNLDSGTWNVAATLAGYTIAAGITRTVTGSEAGTLTDDLAMSADAIVTPPADISMCRLSGFLENLNGIVSANSEITFRLVTVGDLAAKSERVIDRNDITITTDANGQIKDAAGNLYLDLQRNDTMTPSTSFYHVYSKDAGMNWVKMTLSSATFDWKTLIS